MSFQSELPFSLRKFQNFLDNQLPSTVYRAKGLLCFEESELTHIFHLSGKRFTLDDTKRHRKRENKIVLIGKNLQHNELYNQLQACISYTHKNKVH
ncbi:putative metal chaperone [Prochlorococcus marinus str. SS2]|uniref:GTP-binding protein n=1 Tax=Prochlorococcus marinus TaxID=1219 RepID=UPI000533A30F|nr:GTP-binding protein [Prochlorococcus marinus]KGG19948.1 putative metal chaperone [Prochlorococcus marinus str. SS2]